MQHSTETDNWRTDPFRTPAQFERDDTSETKEHRRAYLTTTSRDFRPCHLAGLKAISEANARGVYTRGGKKKTHPESLYQFMRRVDTGDVPVDWIQWDLWIMGLVERSTLATSPDPAHRYWLNADGRRVMHVFEAATNHDDGLAAARALTPVVPVHAAETAPPATDETATVLTDHTAGRPRVEDYS